MAEIKTKQCRSCNEMKELTDYYRYRSDCKKCFSKIANKNYIHLNSGLEKKKYDEIRIKFLEDSTILNKNQLSKKYDIEYSLVKGWFRKGWVDEWRKKYIVESK